MTRLKQLCHDLTKTVNSGVESAKDIEEFIREYGQMIYNAGYDDGRSGNDPDKS